MKLTVAKLVLSVVSAVGLMPSAFGADTFTTSKAGDFDLGQRLVTCAAFYDFAAELTASLNKPAATDPIHCAVRSRPPKGNRWKPIG